jgi:hypothetical protein
MNIRQLKNYLVDVILHENSVITEKTQFGDSDESWIIKNSTLTPHLQIIVSDEGVMFDYDDAWQHLEKTVGWTLFPSVYAEEIVSALEVSDRIKHSDVLGLRSLLSHVKSQLP